MELIPIYKDGKELKCAPNQMSTVQADGWSTEKPTPKAAPQVEKPVQRTVAKTTAKTESVKKSSDNVDSR